VEIIVADELPLVRVGLRALLLERSLVPSAEVGLNAELDAYLDAQMDGTCLLLGSLPDAELLEVAQAWVHRGAKVALLVARVTAEDIAAGELLGIQQICLRHSEQSEIAAWIEATVLGMPYRSAALTELVALTPIATTDANYFLPANMRCCDSWSKDDRIVRSRHNSSSPLPPSSHISKRSTQSWKWPTATKH